jgi:glutamate-5-semialdehyde dehydrogenase
VSPTIHAPPRFSLFTACVILVGTLFIEALFSEVLDRLLAVGVATGLIRWTTSGATISTALMIVLRLTSFALITGFALAWTHETPRSLGRLRFSPWQLPFAFVPIAMSLPIFISEVDNLIRWALPHTSLHNWDLAPELGALVGTSWLGPFLAIVVASVTEEILFRGLILRGLLARWKPWPAITISALLFTVMHFNPAQVPVTFVLGLVLGFVYVRTRSLGLCIAGHAINNGLAFIWGDLPVAIDNYNHVPDPAVGFFHPLWFDGGGLVLFGVGLWLIHRWTPPAEPWTVREIPPTVPPPLPESLCAPPLLGDASSQMSVQLAQLVTSLAQRARAASLRLATAPTAKKDAALEKLAALIDASHFTLLEANQRDLLSPEAGALAPAARERLTLNEAKLRQLSASVREVALLPDPVGELIEEINRPNGLRIRKLRVPIGVIGIIYEARPNVTIDCAVLCLKSGNASILRGGKECFHTNLALTDLVQQALRDSDLPADAVQLVPTTDRAALNTLLKLDTLIHCIIPRGGESLIRYVAENSTIPVIKHYKGVCFVYVDADADLAMAESITLNAKASRPSVCNAAEQLLVHRSVAEQFLPAAARALAAKNVELRCDPDSDAILARAAIATKAATPADFTTEFLDYIIAVRVVDSLDAAIATINRDSSNHSDAIVTRDEAAARRFLAEVDSATVYWNASTRFTDGFEFGYGAEIGISTDRLHARGPMGLRELCTHKFLIEGTGQVRV